MYWSYSYPYTHISQQRRERIYSEDLLSRNIGRVVTIYLTFENNSQWNAKIIKGTLREVGRDFVVIRDRNTGKDHMFLNINIDYVVFEQPAQLAGRE